MSESIQDNESGDLRSPLCRVIEASCVVAAVAAIMLWQSDQTLDAARQFFGLAEPLPTVAPMAPMAPMTMRPIASDLHLAPKLSDSPSVAPPTSIVVDRSIQTASISPAPSAVPILRDRPSAPVVTSALPTAFSGGPAAFSPVPLAVTRSVVTPVEGPRWTAACDETNGEFCIAAQVLASPGDPLIETSWTIEHGSDGLVAIWTAPAGVDIAHGMALIMGEGEPKTMPFTSCGLYSCESRLSLAGDFVDRLRRSARVSTEIVLANGKMVHFDFTRDGLDDALARLGV